MINSFLKRRGNIEINRAAPCSWRERRHGTSGRQTRRQASGYGYAGGSDHIFPRRCRQPRNERVAGRLSEVGRGRGGGGGGEEEGVEKESDPIIKCMQTSPDQGTPRRLS